MHFVASDKNSLINLDQIIAVYLHTYSTGEQVIILRDITNTEHHVTSPNVRKLFDRIWNYVVEKDFS